MLLLKKTIIKSCQRATKVLALSEECKSILNLHGISESKMFISPNGVSNFWGMDSNLDILKSYGVVKPYILYVSHFHHYKNFKNLIFAYSFLPDQIKDSYNLVLIGNPDDKNCFKDIKSTINELGLSKQIIILPALDKELLRDFYQKADIFVFASLIENSPNILLEAMMSGAPILSSNLAPMPEFCMEAAIYFNPLDAKELSIKIKDLVFSTEKKINMKELSINQAKQFSWDKFTETVIQEIRNINKI